LYDSSICYYAPWQSGLHFSAFPQFALQKQPQAEYKECTAMDSADTTLYVGRGCGGEHILLLVLDIHGHANLRLMLGRDLACDGMVTGCRYVAALEVTESVHLSYSPTT
jgi:hypothetical protein